MMITSDVVIGNILEALRGGAYDFIGKPIRLEELQVTICNAIEAQSLRSVRREPHSSRPPTTPDVGFRIRRFVKHTQVAVLASAVIL